MLTPFFTQEVSVICDMFSYWPETLYTTFTACSEALFLHHSCQNSLNMEVILSHCEQHRGDMLRVYKLHQSLVVSDFMITLTAEKCNIYFSQSKYFLMFWKCFLSHTQSCAQKSWSPHLYLFIWSCSKTWVKVLKW